MRPVKFSAPIPAPKLTSSTVTLSVDNNVASESGNLIVLLPVILDVSNVTRFSELAVSFIFGRTKVLLNRSCVAFSSTVTLTAPGLFSVSVGG